MWLGKKYPYSTSTLTACDGRAFLTACDGLALPMACDGLALPTACDGHAFLTACDGRALPAGLSGVGIRSENQVAGRSNPVFSSFPAISRNFHNFVAGGVS
jgi:hypothetical protein